MKHRREHPEPLATKSSSANVTTFALFANVQPHTDNRDMSTIGENRNTFLKNVATGAAIGVGIGVGVAGALWLYDRVSNQKEPSQRQFSFAVPAFEPGRVVGEVIGEEEEEEVQSLDEAQHVTLM